MHSFMKNHMATISDKFKRFKGKPKLGAYSLKFQEKQTETKENVWQRIQILLS